MNMKTNKNIKKGVNVFKLLEMNIKFQGFIYYCSSARFWHFVLIFDWKKLKLWENAKRLMK